MTIQRTMLLAAATAAFTAAAAGQTTTIFVDHFNDNSAGWTFQGTWEIGPAAGYSHNPSGAGGPYSDPSVDGSGVAGGGVAGSNIGGGIPGGTYGFRWLTSPAVDVTGHDVVLLRYRRDVAAPDDSFGDSQIQVFDGAAWVPIWTASANESLFFFVVDWQTHTLDVSAYANAAFQVRIGYSGDSITNLVAGMPGWTIDDFELLGHEASPNDLCSAATPLGLGANAGHLFGATATNPQPTSCGSFTTSTIDCWYTFTSALGGDYDFVRSGGTRMALYTGADCAALTQVAGSCGTGTTFSNIAIAPNATYWLRLGGAANTDHTITVSSRAARVVIGTGCPATTTLVGSADPVLGSTRTITLTSQPNALGALLLSDPNLAAFYTPFGPCTLYVANPATILLALNTDAVGQWSLTATFPSDPLAAGIAFDLQCLTFGALGFEASNGLRLILGT